MRLKLMGQFESVVERYQRDIVNFQYRLTGNRFTAEDLAQETFIKAFKKIDSVKDIDKVKSWIYSIARNVAVDYFRKNKEKTVPLDNIALENYAKAITVDYSGELERKQLSNGLHKTISQLSEDDQRIVRLLYFEGFSYKEICFLLNINQNTLKSRLFRARKALLAAIEANGLMREAVAES